MNLQAIKPACDYHIHSIFSDGANTYNEIVEEAARIGLRTIAITDHSDEYMAHYKAPRLLGFYHASHRWANTINDVQVIRGLELDLLTPDGEMSNLENYRHQPQFMILSAHSGVYQGPNDSITIAYQRAIDRYSKILHMIGHPCSTYFGKEWDQGIDIEKIVQLANDAEIGIEVNGVALLQQKTNLDKLRYVCQNAKILYINTDAHAANEMKQARQKALEFALSWGRVEAERDG